MWNQERYREFWRFIAERHEVFRRRVIFRQPPPWTKDPILQTVAFTNIYRELDRASRVLIRSLPPAAIIYSADENQNVLFNIIKFRFFTWPATYEALGGYQDVGIWNSARAAKVLVQRQRAGAQVFTGAFMVTSLGARPGLGGKVRLVVKRIDWVKRNLDRLTEQVFTPPAEAFQDRLAMQHAHRALVEIPGFGGFMAYEVLIDLTYTGRVPYGTDDWVFVGPGAVKGLRELFAVPVVKRMHERSFAYQELVAALRDGQVEGFRQAGVVLNGPRLTLENIEQALCEYQKYVRAKAGGHSKRKFNQEQVNLLDSFQLWDDIPPEFLREECWVR